MVSSEWVHQRRVILLTIDHSQLTKSNNYAKKLFNHRVEKSIEE